MKQLPTDRHVTYQTCYVTCSQCKACKAGGKGHGPYVYAMWRNDDKRLIRKYMGKLEPAIVEVARRNDDGLYRLLRVAMESMDEAAFNQLCDHIMQIMGKPKSEVPA